MELPKIQREALSIIVDVMENGKDSDRVAAAAAILDLVIRSINGRTWLEFSSDQRSTFFDQIADAIGKQN